MRIIWISDAVWHPTGYGITTNYICRRLAADGHEVYNFAPGALHQGIVDLAPNLKVLSSNFGDDRWGNKTLMEHVNRIQPDLIISWLDPQGMDGYGWSEVPIFMWDPVDTWPVAKHEVAILNRARKIMVPSRWGIEVLEKQGIECSYLPGGIDLDLYDINIEGRARWRKQLKPDISDSTFLIGSVGLNTGSPDRKGYGFEFDAIKLFHERHPEIDFRVYIHTNPQGDGMSMNLYELREELGLTDVISFCRPQGATSESPIFMRDMYNAFDVLLHTGMCEGIGLPIIEAQACGTPVVANACTSMTELLGPGNYPAKPLADMLVHTSTRIALPDVEEIYKNLLQAWTDWETDRTSHPPLELSRRQVIRKNALDFDQGRIYEEYWKPLLVEAPKRFLFQDAGPRKLMLAAGQMFKPGFVHHDREILYDHHDVAHDLNVFPYPWEDDSWDYIEFSDCLEHLRANFLNVMDELWRITAPGGHVFIHTAEAGSWQLSMDPTHVLGFSMDSMDFLDPDRPYGQISHYTEKRWRVEVKTLDNSGLVFVLQPRKDAVAAEPEMAEATA